MTERDREVDVVVIGMGPGGEYAAGRLAEAGLAVAGVEARLVGGECPYWGCVPSKMMIRAADLLAEGHRINGMAGRGQADPDWAPVARRIRDEATDSWDDKVAADRFTGKGGILVRGHGRISAPGEVTVVARRPGRAGLAARRCCGPGAGIVVATGTAPAVPPIPGLAGHPVLDQPRGDRDRARCPGRWSCWAAARSGPSSRRSSPGSAARSRWWRARPTCCRSRSPRPGTCSRRCSAGRASGCAPAIPAASGQPRRDRVHGHPRQRGGH